MPSDQPSGVTATSARKSFFESERDGDMRAILLMAAVLLVYTIPIALGYSWSALGSSYNALDPAEGYAPHPQGTRLTVEAWGASVVSVPDHIKTRLYLTTGQLPLWNPYQGLGQPMAAMGEGSPYFPPAMLRSLAPYSWENAFLVVEIFIAQLFLFYFLRLAGLSRIAAAFGGAAFALSGAVSFHLARANILDQILMMPVLFWGVAFALSRQSVGSYVALSVVTALHVAGGFIQVAMTTQVLALIYAAVMVRFYTDGGRSAQVRALAQIGVSTIIGVGLASFYALPLLDWLTTGAGKNVPLLGFLSLPFANVVAFFFPILHGPWFDPLWMPSVPGAYSAPSWVPNWDNIYAVCGTGILLVSLSAVWGTKWPTSQRAWFYFFFLIAGAFLTLRYAAIAPASLVNWLPIIGRQSPKHANALMAFCFVVAASGVVDNLRNIDLRKATIMSALALVYAACVTASMFGTHLYSLYEVGSLPARRAGRDFLVYAGLTALISAAALICLRSAIRLASRSAYLAGALLLGFVCMELFLYVPLGRSLQPYVFLHFALAALLFGGIYLLVYRPHVRAVAAASAMIAASMAGYVVFIVAPWSGGLTRAYDLTKPPKFMHWLAGEGGLYRSFGIFPDYSVAAKLQDISVVGPLAPQEFEDFVWLISNDRANGDYVRTGHFMLAGPWHFEADAYFSAKPIFDWIGVKYLVIDPGKMARPEATKFLGSSILQQAYKDDRVTVLRSNEARGKAEYWPEARVADDRKAILEWLKADPVRALGEPSIEKAESGSFHPGAPGPSRDVAVDVYALDRVELSLPDDARGGIVVVKDVYAPSWHAEINGKAAPIVRVNGIVRGVLVPAEGGKRLVLKYEPNTFVAGMFLSALCLGFIACLLLLWRLGFTTARAPGALVTVVAVIISLVVLAAAGEAYFKNRRAIGKHADIAASYSGKQP